MRKDFLWAEKYRPNNINNFIFDSDIHKNQIINMINNNEIPHLLFSGPAGCGKTTLSKILINELSVDSFDVKIINASDENSVDDMRKKIKIFAEGFPMGDYKVIQLEEMDFLSQASMAVLRNIMEEHADTCRFIGTCNYENKISSPVKSRFQHLQFKSPNIDEILVYISEILFTENVEFDVDLLDKYVTSCYPDIRNIINTVQQNSIDGVLIESSVQNTNNYKFKLLELIEKSKFNEMRDLVCSQVQKEQIEDVYRFLYDNIQKSPVFKDIDNFESAVVLIAKYLYRHVSFSDPEINLAALFIELGMFK